MAVVGVPDERLDRVAATVGATPIVHETIQFHDIAGLVRGRPPGRGARQPVPRQHPRDRRDPARGPRPRRRAGDPPGGPGRPARRRRDGRDRAAVRRPRAGRAPARARGKAGALARQGARGRGALAARGGRGARARAAAVRTVPAPDDAPGAVVRLSALTSKPVLYVANVAEGEPLEPSPALVEHARERARVRLRSAPGSTPSSPSWTTTRPRRCAPSWAWRSPASRP